MGSREFTHPAIIKLPIRRERGGTGIDRLREFESLAGSSFTNKPIVPNLDIGEPHFRNHLDKQIPI